MSCRSCASASAAKLVPRLPVVLWSFGGSGNTFARKLLEEASGALTGSVYHSNWLHRTFKAELLPLNTSCRAIGLIAVKVHGGMYERPWVRRTCRGQLHRAIFLVRHPFRAALAEYQRSAIEKKAQVIYGRNGSGRDPHISTIDVLSAHAWGGWPHRAVELARRWLLLVGCHQPHGAAEHRDVWSTRYWQMIHPRCRLDTAYGKWLAASKQRQAIIVRYEDLAHAERGPAELLRMLGFAVPGFAATRSIGSDGVQGVRCALCAARPLRRQAPSADVAATVEAGGAAGGMWHIVSGAAPRFGYTRFNYDSLMADKSTAAARRETHARTVAANPPSMVTHNASAQDQSRAQITRRGGYIFVGGRYVDDDARWGSWLDPGPGKWWSRHLLARTRDDATTLVARLARALRLRPRLSEADSDAERVHAAQPLSAASTTV